MKHNKIRQQLLFICCILCLSTLFYACQKETGWLDQKSDKALVVPTTLQDMQALLNNEEKINILDASLGFVAGESYYITDNRWQTISNATQRNTYIWAANTYEGSAVSDWNNSYQQVYYTNVVLEGLQKIQPTQSTQTQYKETKGTALFHRSYAFYKLAQLFAPVYNQANAAVSLGLPLRLGTDINERVDRASLQQTYNRIINDLHIADTLLPNIAVIKSKPSRVAINALLARIYLSMSDYDKALHYADQALGYNSSLLDYNTLNAGAAYPIPLFNTEDLFHTRYNTYLVMANFVAITDSQLYRSYAPDDLRRTIFFKNNTGVPFFKGSYEGGSAYYSGLATDELYLIRAECKARKNQTAAAMQDLNILLQKRWKTGTFIPYTATDATDAIQKILMERRKELVFRGLRWTDLRRLNQNPGEAVTLTRAINGQTYTLSPGSPRYTFPIPDDEINLTGMQQNPG